MSVNFEELKEKLLEEAVNFYGDKNLKDLERLHAACTCYWLTGGNGVHFHFTGDQGVETIDSYELENIVIEFNNAFTEPLKETEVLGSAMA